MSAGYGVMELATAAKPGLLLYLLDRSETATYLDPDIKVYQPLTDCFDAAARSSIALTPHCLFPVPRDGFETSERTLMLAGMFNLGFLSVSQRSRQFLRWWHERLRHDAIIDVENGLFADQRWVDWVPSLFEHVVLRDPGLNVAYWNVHERDIRRTASGQIYATGHQSVSPCGRQATGGRGHRHAAVQVDPARTDGPIDLPLPGPQRPAVTCLTRGRYEDLPARARSLARLLRSPKD